MHPVASQFQILGLACPQSTMQTCLQIGQMRRLYGLRVIGEHAGAPEVILYIETEEVKLHLTLPCHNSIQVQCCKDSRITRDRSFPRRSNSVAKPPSSSQGREARSGCVNGFFASMIWQCLLEPAVQR